MSIMTQPRPERKQTKYNQPIIIIQYESIVVNDLFNVGMFIQVNELFVFVRI